MATDGQDFEIYAGRNAAIVITVAEDGVADDISTVTDIVWYLRRTPDGAAVLTKQKTVSSGITFVTDGTDGKFTVNLSLADAAGLSGFYFHEAILTDGSGNETTVATGRVQVGPAPAWTYSGDPSNSDLDAIRYMVGDTSISDPLVNDPEVLFALAQRGSNYGAAAMICRSLAAKFARQADVSDRDLRTSLSQRASAFRAMATDYENQATEKSALVFVAGLPSCYQQ